METAKVPRSHQVPANRYRRQLDKATAKAELVRLYNGESFGRGNIVAAKKAFVSEYNRPDGKYSKLSAIVGPVSFQSLERWKFKLERCGNDPSCLIDSRGMRWTRRRRPIKRIVSRLVRIITAVAPKSREQWFQFLEGLRDGKTPDDIATSVGISIHTVHRWTRRLIE